MKAYKGFNKDMTCKGFQFEEGKEYHEDAAKLCKSGFHACENPLDCFRYYPPGTSVYHEVDLDEVSNERGNDSKVCGKYIKIGARLDIAGIVKLAIDYCKLNANEDDYGASSATGDYGASSATGDYGASSATGYRGASSATGYRGASSATGYCGVSSATGNCGASSTTGDYGASSATGNSCVALSSGYKGKAKASLGSAICICERGGWDGATYPLLAIKAAIIDGEVLKSDTWYKLENGEFIECE